jgi:hypothetical protein
MIQLDLRDVPKVEYQSAQLLNRASEGESRILAGWRTLKLRLSVVGGENRGSGPLTLPSPLNTPRSRASQ